MAGIQDYKELESEIHKQLYNNLYLLSHFYPTSDNFNKIFKKDMFIKNNKAAFFEVIHYLLNALDPEATSKRLLSWPPYDPKVEVKFRSELLSYVNELNQLYESARIPQIMASHLISPGGFKVAHLIFKLSQLVIFEHLKKTHEGLLYCPSVTNEQVYNIQNVNLNSEKSVMKKEIHDDLEGFNEFHQHCLDRSEKIMKSLSQVDKKIEEAKQVNKVAREEFNRKYPSYPSLGSLKEKLDCLAKEWQDLKTTVDTINTVRNLLCHLNSTDALIEYNKEELKIPTDILHIVKGGNELNLIELFEGLNFLLGCKALEVPNLDSLCNDRNKELLMDISCKYVNNAYRLKEEILQFKTSINKLSEKIKLIEDFDTRLQKNIYGAK